VKFPALSHSLNASLKSVSGRPLCVGSRKNWVWTTSRRNCCRLPSRAMERSAFASPLPRRWENTPMRFGPRRGTDKTARAGIEIGPMPLRRCYWGARKSAGEIWSALEPGPGGSGGGQTSPARPCCVWVSHRQPIQTPILTPVFRISTRLDPRLKLLPSAPQGHHRAVVTYLVAEPCFDTCPRSSAPLLSPQAACLLCSRCISGIS
jgi:hypothetical protein